MSAIPLSQLPVSDSWQAQFLSVLPAVTTHAQIRFRHLPVLDREEAIQEAIASACVSYQRLAAKGMLTAATPATLATFAVKQARGGRHVGGKQDGAPSRALPQIALCNDTPVTIARPAEGSSLQFDAFPLPPVPQTLADWCAKTSLHFWIEHGRCLGIMLLLDVRRLAWSTAIPAQRCGKHASCWSAALADFPTFPPDTVLAGSFQTRVLSGGEEPLDCPPPHDGVHLVQQVATEEQPQPIWCLARAGGRTFGVDAPQVLDDDARRALDEALFRLTLL